MPKTIFSVVNIFLVLAGHAGLLCADAQAASPSEGMAFPGARGYGQTAVGWRSGKIIHVTNLLDSGPGSLRDCVEQSDKPRICVFDVSGTILVDGEIKARPNVYVAGQTAPGDGIQIRLGKGQSTPFIVKNSHDVVLRFLKFRPGASSKPAVNVSGLLIENSQRVMVDHCSIQFAVDQNFSVHFEHASTYDVTLQQSIVSWGLDHSNHPKGRHSKGALICSGVQGPDECGRISIVENLFAHNRDRNPDISGTDLGPIDVINNIFYNPISQFGEFYDRYASTTIRYVNNLGIVGPSTKQLDAPLVETYDFDPRYAVAVEASGNMVLDLNSQTPRPGDIKMAEGAVRNGEDDAESVHSADSLLDYLLPKVGAGARPGGGPDVLDSALLQSVKDRKGSVVDTPEEAGGWPDLAELHGPKDSDQDGMPDEWEDSHQGLDKNNDADAWADRNADGWANIEEYLSARAGD